MNPYSRLLKDVKGIEFKLLAELTRLSYKTKKRSPSGAFYCFPSEAYLARRVGVRRETVSRHICRLHREGFIRRTRRRKVQGRWQTNLYVVGKWAARVVRKTIRAVLKLPDHVRKTAHIASPKGEEVKQIWTGRAELDQILAKWYAKGDPSPP